MSMQLQLKVVFAGLDGDPLKCAQLPGGGCSQPHMRRSFWNLVGVVEKSLLMGQMRAVQMSHV